MENNEIVHFLLRMGNCVVFFETFMEKRHFENTPIYKSVEKHSKNISVCTLQRTQKLEI